jgi:hypothetical protein
MDMNTIVQTFGITQGDFEKLCSNSNTDYSSVPTPILVQPQIINELFDKISFHNIEYSEDYGFSISSFFALKQIKKKKKKDIKYEEKFQLEGDADGKEYLKKLFRMIADSNPNNKNTIMKIIESIQDKYNMKPSTIDDPKLFPLFLPTHSHVGNLNLLMKTIKRFVSENKLWENYHLCYSNSVNRSDEDNCDYTTWIDKQLEISRRDKKQGCILLLGDQGKLGHTYHKCDASIHLDNGVNIDAVKQAYYRSLTEREGKTIGINVDLNIQRVYNYMYKIIQDYKRNNSKAGNNEDILQTLYKEKLFIFNPQEFDFGDYEVSMIEYFKKFSDRMKEEISIDAICDRINCDDNLNKMINEISLNNDSYTVNENLNGKQTDVKKPGQEKKKTDPVSDDKERDEGDDDESNESNESNEGHEDNTCISINKTKILYESLTKLCGLLLKSSWINPDIRKEKSKLDLLKELKDDEYLFSIIKSKISKDFEIDETNLNIIYDKYIETMMNNMDVLDDIFEIYSTTSSDKLRKVIEKHFIPTKKQEKENAEIPTPVACCDEMTNELPQDYFKDIHKTLEPCCGKGNFVLAIFDRFYEGLSHINDKLLRCQTIIEKCIYYSDTEHVNIFITRHLLMCHAISKFSENEQWKIYQKVNDFNYNENIGDTLEINIKNKWCIDGFDAIIGNPPYQERNKNGKSKHGKTNLWTKFIEYSFKNMNPSGYLLFITPSSWMNGTVSCFNSMINRQIHSMNIGECKKYFKGVGSTFSYYLIENKEIYKETSYKCKYKENIYEGTILLNKEMKMLPQLLSENMISIINKVFNWDNNNIFIRRDLIDKVGGESRIKDDEYKYPFIAFIKKDGSKDIKFTKVELPTQKIKKVLMFRHGYLNPTYDDGVNGVGDNIHYAEVENEIEGIHLLRLLKSPFITFIFEICKTSQFNNGRVMNWLYRKNPQYDNIYKLYNLTDNEIKFIDTHLLK